MIEASAFPSARFYECREKLRRPGGRGGHGPLSVTPWNPMENRALPFQEATMIFKGPQLPSHFQTKPCI